MTFAAIIRTSPSYASANIERFGEGSLIERDAAGSDVKFWVVDSADPDTAEHGNVYVLKEGVWGPIGGAVDLTAIQSQLDAQAAVDTAQEAVDAANKAVDDAQTAAIANKEDAGVAATLDAALQAQITSNETLNAAQQTAITANIAAIAALQASLVKPDYEAAETDAAGILNKPDLTQSETYNVAKAAAGEYVKGVSRTLWNGYQYILNTDAVLQVARGNTDTVDQTVLPSAGDGSESSDWVLSGVVSYPTIEQMLKEAATSPIVVVITARHSDAVEGGGGVFEWQPLKAKSEADGGVVFDPDRPIDIASQTATGATGAGCWVRVDHDYVSPQMYGAITGDPLIDSWASFQACLSNQEYVSKIPTADYYLSAPVNASLTSMIGIAAGRFDIGPKLIFDAGVQMGVFVAASRNNEYSFFEIDITATTTSRVAMLVQYAWKCVFRNIRSDGGLLSSDVPVIGNRKYGLVMRSQYIPANYTNVYPELLELDAIQLPTGFKGGVYYNSIENCWFPSHHYGLAISGSEGASAPPAATQLYFQNNSFENCWRGTATFGTGGGITLFNHSCEVCGDDAIKVINPIGGTSPLIIGGEISSIGGVKLRGPALVLQPASGTGWSNPNDDGEMATMIRSVGGVAHAEGEAYLTKQLISDYEDYYPLKADGGIVSTGAIKEIARIVGVGSSPTSFLLTFSASDADGAATFRASVSSHKRSDGVVVFQLDTITSHADWPTGVQDVSIIGFVNAGVNLQLIISLTTDGAAITNIPYTVRISDIVYGDETGITLG